MGDFKPAPTIREIPFPAPIAFSIVNLEGSNSVGVPEPELLRECRASILLFSTCRKEFVCYIPDGLAKFVSEFKVVFGVKAAVNSSDDREVLSYEFFTEDSDASRKLAPTELSDLSSSSK